MDQNKLSNAIRDCRAGVVANPYQGSDKRVLFVCSMGILRSATGARLYAHKYNTRTAGTWDDALIPVTKQLIDWADEVVFVQASNFDQSTKKFGYDWHDKARVLNIPDNYEHMHPELIRAFKQQYNADVIVPNSVHQFMNTEGFGL